VLGYLVLEALEPQVLLALPVRLEVQVLAGVGVLMVAAVVRADIPFIAPPHAARFMFITTVLRVVVGLFVLSGRDLHDHFHQPMWRNDYGTLYSNS
jgi:hypothetical protein